MQHAVSNPRPLLWTNMAVNVVATFCVLQSESKHSYKIRKDQVVLGRNAEQCDIHIPHSNLSKQHCQVLIDKDDHFIMDLDSRNKTYRRAHCLRPNTYYELTNGIKITLADMECQYFIGDVNDGEEDSTDATTMLPDSVAEETPSLCRTNSVIVDTELDAPLFPSNKVADDCRSEKSSVTCSTRSPSPQLTNGVPPVMPPLPEDPLSNVVEDDPETMECSPLLLATDGDVTRGKDDDQQTLAYECDEIVSADVTMAITPSNEYKTNIIDPTVAYDIETDNELESGDKGISKAIEPTVGYFLEEENDSVQSEPTVVNQINKEDKNSNNETAPKISETSKKADKCPLKVTATVPYDMEEGENSGECASDTMPKPATADKPQDSSDSATGRQGRSRRHISSSQKIVTNGESGEGVMESSAQESEQPAIKVTVRKGRGAKRQLSEDESEEMIVPSKKRIRGRQKQTRFESLDSTAAANTQELFDESPDVPTVDTPTHDNLITNTKTEVPKQSSVDNDSDGFIQSGKGRGGRKRKIPLKKVDEEKTSDELVIVPSKRTRGRSKKKTFQSLDITDDTAGYTQTKESPTVDTPTRDNVTKTKTEDDDQSSVNDGSDGCIQSGKGRGGRKRKTPLNKEKTSDESIPIASKNERKQRIKKSTSVKKSDPSSPLPDSDESTCGVENSEKVKLVTPKLSIKKCTANSNEVDQCSSPVKDPCTLRVLFTGGVDEAETVKRLGGEIADSVFDCTHLITDKVRRTVKFLCCLSRGCSIVSTKWLDKSSKAEMFIPSEPFFVKDKANERVHKFVLKDSIAKAKSAPLLKGWSVYVSENVKPCPKEMSEIIQSAGGKVLEQCPVVASDKQFIISCEEDVDSIKDSIAKGVTVCSSEVLLTGVLRQELQTDIHTLGKKTSGKQRRR